ESESPRPRSLCVEGPGAGLPAVSASPAHVCRCCLHDSPPRGRGRRVAPALRASSGRHRGKPKRAGAPGRGWPCGSVASCRVPPATSTRPARAGKKLLKPY
ncbi:unnamed protein product, partial [Amoebophrya sp. A120]